MKKIRELLFNAAWWLCEIAYQQKMNWRVWWHEKKEEFFGIPSRVIGIPETLWKYLIEPSKKAKVSRCQFFEMLIRNGIELYKMLSPPGSKLIIRRKGEDGKVIETEIIMPWNYGR